MNLNKIQSSKSDSNSISLEKIVVVGSGNFGTAISNEIALNINQNSQLKDRFCNNIQMWVYGEIYEDRNLSQIINENHENPKYLPGIKLSPNVIATENLIETVCDADYIFLVIPSKYLKRTLETLSGNIKSTAIICSMIKGLEVTKDGPEFISAAITKILNTTNVCSVMGANVASEVIVISKSKLNH